MTQEGVPVSVAVNPAAIASFIDFACYGWIERTSFCPAC